MVKESENKSVRWFYLQLQSVDQTNLHTSKKTFRNMKTAIKMCFFFFYRVKTFMNLVIQKFSNNLNTT